MSDILNQRAIADLVPRGSHVLDLGCGDGSLLAYLQKERACTGYGVELDDANVLACLQRGVNVIQLNLDAGLTLFGDASFDVVLQIDTLQTFAQCRNHVARDCACGPAGHSGIPQFCALAQPTEYSQRPDARHQAPAVPVVRHT